MKGMVQIHAFLGLVIYHVHGVNIRNGGLAGSAQ